MIVFILVFGQETNAVYYATELHNSLKSLQYIRQSHYTDGKKG